MKCPECHKQCKPSISYEDTYYCENCKEYFGKRSQEANGINLIREGEN